MEERNLILTTPTSFLERERGLYSQGAQKKRDPKSVPPAYAQRLEAVAGADLSARGKAATAQPPPRPHATPRGQSSPVLTTWLRPAGPQLRLSTCQFSRSRCVTLPLPSKMLPR